MKNHKTQYMAFMAMFLAIEIALVLTPLGYIQLGIISATTMHIPVIIAGITLGKKSRCTIRLCLWLNEYVKCNLSPITDILCLYPFYYHWRNERKLDKFVNCLCA